MSAAWKCLLLLSVVPFQLAHAEDSSKTLELVLRLKEKVAIETLAESVLDPSSPRYGRPYSVAEIREIVAPSDSDYAKLLEGLKSTGFELVSESPSRLIITVRAP